MLDFYEEYVWPFLASVALAGAAVVALGIGIGVIRLVFGV